MINPPNFQTVNIPTIDWSGSGLKVENENGKDNLEVGKELFNRATVSSAKEGLKCLKEKGITYPVMIKASEGGGGKGIRKCVNDEEFVINFNRVQVSSLLSFKINVYSKTILFFRLKFQVVQSF